MGNKARAPPFQRHRRSQSEGRGALNTLEAVAIAMGEPRLDVQRGKWGEAEQYFEWWERNAAAPAEENEG